ncbi:MAG: cupin domain-containing protein, partial [Pirellulales bacterium]
AKLHYHARTDEIYYIISGKGKMVLDDVEIEVHQGVVVYVPRGTRHKAVGELTVLTVCILEACLATFTRSNRPDCNPP